MKTLLTRLRDVIHSNAITLKNLWYHVKIVQKTYKFWFLHAAPITCTTQMSSIEVDYTLNIVHEQTTFAYTICLASQILQHLFVLHLCLCVYARINICIHACFMYSKRASASTPTALRT